MVPTPHRLLAVGTIIGRIAELVVDERDGSSLALACRCIHVYAAPALYRCIQPSSTKWYEGQAGVSTRHSALYCIFKSKSALAAAVRSVRMVSSPADEATELLALCPRIKSLKLELFNPVPDPVVTHSRMSDRCQ